jgi:hypothetical protein
MWRESANGLQCGNEKLIENMKAISWRKKSWRKPKA